MLANVVGFIYRISESLSQQPVSAFSTQSDSAKPANKLEFVTDKEAADRLGVKSQRTIRRYKRHPCAREILGVVPYGKQLRIPKHQDWAKIARELKSLGKAPRIPPGRIFKREMGWGNPRRERDTKILRLALELERLRQKRRLTKKLKWQQEEVWKRAQIIAAKHHCTVFNAPKFFRKYLEAANEKERKHNAPQIKWLKDNGLWGEARKRIKNGGGDALFDVIEEFEREGKEVSIPRRISLHSVQTSTQLSRKGRQFRKLWPSQQTIEIATAKYNNSWWQLDLEQGAKLLRRQKKSITVKNLCDVLYRDESAEWQNRRGISRSSYYRRRYTKADLARVRRVKAGNELRLPFKKSGGFHDDLKLDRADLAKMSIHSTGGWKLYNPFRDK
jgi:hypothetical protein